MAAYLILALSGLLVGLFFLHGLLDQLRADPQASVIDVVVGSSTGNALAPGIVTDTVLAGFAFLIWLVHEAASLSMRRPWVYVALFFATPLGFLAPLFLFMRERKLAKLGWD